VTDAADLTSAAHDLVATLDAERSELRARTAAARIREKEIATARRDGRLGRDWQVLQQRIDMRHTTVSDILNGLDQSEEARAVRGTAGKTLARVRDAYREKLSEPDSELQASLDALVEARNRLAAESARLQSFPETT
jgi:predicted  nucleic acid-binding Zn-ribbon protein